VTRRFNPLRDIHGTERPWHSRPNKKLHRRVQVFYHGLPTAAEQQDPENPPLCYIHIPKTGGTLLTNAMRHNIARACGPPNLFYCAHRHTAGSTRRDYGDARQLAMVLRDPVDRFVSAYYSRMNFSKPEYNVPWSPEEKTFYETYPTIPALIDALWDRSRAVRVETRVAIDTVFLLRRGYRGFFRNLDRLEQDKDRFRICMPIEYLDARKEEMMRLLGFVDFEEPPRPRANIGLPRPKLTFWQRRALRKYLREEYEIYKKLRGIAKKLHGV